MATVVIGGLAPSTDRPRAEPGAKIEELSKAVEKGKTVYAVEMIVDGHTRELLLDPDGKVIAIE